jgi:hypothetical protein
MPKIISSFSELLTLGVHPVHIEILKKYSIFKGRVIEGGREFGGAKHPEIQPDGIVSVPHRLHNLIRGVYVNQKDQLVQSINSTGKKWGKELEYEDDDHWTIKYAFGTNYRFPSNISSLRTCYEKGIPIGASFNVSHGVNRILGLGKIENIRGTTFTICSFTPSSTLTYETDESALQYTKKKHEQKNYSSNVKETTVLARSSQRWFREELLREYKQCVFCGLKKPEYLVGAHIVPHSTMQKEDPENSMNPNNGLLLCKLCDIAFERGDIHVSNLCEIIISKKLNQLATDDHAVMNWLSGIGEKLILKNNGYNPDKKYLDWKFNL